jgi:hypothetical protein
MRASAGALLSLALLIASVPAAAGTYRVGKAGQYADVSSIVEKVLPGDVIELVGDITDSFMLSRNGTPEHPIVVRGIARVVAGRTRRPRITVTNSTMSGVTLAGDWIVLEGVEVTGALGLDDWGYAVLVTGSHVTVRDCFIHHNRASGLGAAKFADDLLVEFCEFDSNGSGMGLHSMYFASGRPSAKVTVQFCYVHDGTGGNLLKSRFPRNIIRYNWFESPYFFALNLVGPQVLSDDGDRKPANNVYPLHSDIIGNVVIQGASPGSGYALMSVGGEGDTCPGTEGDFDLSHNLFLATQSPGHRSIVLLVHGNVDHLRLYDNVFLGRGNAPFVLYERGNVWSTPRTHDFVERRQNADPILEGRRNWISQAATNVPVPLSDTLRGSNPRFADFLDNDFHPRPDSPLAGAGIWPLPAGSSTDLVPVFEPQRCVAPGLKPKPRTHGPPVSIGPLEVTK